MEEFVCEQRLHRPYRGYISKKALFRRFASTLTSGYTPPAHFGAVKGHLHARIIGHPE